MSDALRLARWTGPLTSPHPDPRSHPAFDAIRTEVAKLESPTGGTTDWAEVVRLADGYLGEVARDVIVGAALASALGHREGVLGITLGARVLAALLREPSATPARPRARANALLSFVARAEIALDASRERARPALAALVAALDELDEVAGATLGDDAPSLRPLKDRARAALDALPPPEPATPPAAPSASVFAPPPPMPSTASPTPALEPSLPDRAEQVPAFVRRVAGQLVPAAALLRGASPLDADALRVTLVALYLPIHAAPETTRDARTALAAPPKLVLESLAKHHGSAAPESVVRDALGALERSRFALDLHVYLARGLERAGASAAVAVHRHELRGLLARLPELLDREFSDGTRFASPDARALFASWEPTHATSDAASTGLPSAADEIRALARAGRPADALALGARACREAPSARARFECTLAMALAAEDARALPLAVELHAALQELVEQHALGSWEPELAASALRAAIRIGTASGAPDAATRALFARLARIDPRAAFEVSSALGATPAKPGR